MKSASCNMTGQKTSDRKYGRIERVNFFPVSEFNTAYNTAAPIDRLGRKGELIWEKLPLSV